MLQVTWLVLTNQSALFQSREVMLLRNLLMASAAENEPNEVESDLPSARTEATRTMSSQVSPASLRPLRTLKLGLAILTFSLITSDLRKGKREKNDENWDSGSCYFVVTRTWSRCGRRDEFVIQPPVVRSLGGRLQNLARQSIFFFIFFRYYSPAPIFASSFYFYFRAKNKHFFFFSVSLLPRDYFYYFVRFATKLFYIFFFTFQHFH